MSVYDGCGTADRGELAGGLHGVFGVALYASTSPQCWVVRHRRWGLVFV